MKKTTILLTLCALVIITSCSDNGNPNYEPPPTSTKKLNQPTQKPPTKQPNNSSGGGNLNITIPYSSNKIPNDILDQVSWGGKGGGEIKQPCGKCSLDFQENQRVLYLSNFRSNQSLRILVYKETAFNGGLENGVFLTEFYVDVNSKGELKINIDGNIDADLFFFVLDEATDKIEWRIADPPIFAFCPGAPKQRVGIGDKAYVCTKNDSVRLRSGPSKSKDTLLFLVPGAEFDIIYGPACSDNWSWWEIQTESGKIGWIAEGGDNVDPYFICPSK